MPIGTSAGAAHEGTLITLATLAPIVAGLLLGTGAGFWHFRHPFNVSPNHVTLGIFLGCAFAAIGLLSIPKRGRLLLVVATAGCGCLAAFGLVASGSLIASLGVAWLLVLAFGLGDRLMRMVASNLEGTFLEHLAVATGLGLGSLALITLALGSAGLLYRGLLLALLILATGLTFPTLVRVARALNPVARARMEQVWAGEHTRSLAIVVAALAVCALVPLVWAVAGSISYDDLNYQVAVPAIYVREHAIVAVPEEFRSYWAHNANMLYALGLACFGFPFPTLFHFACGIAAALVAFNVGRRASGSRVGALAALLFFAVPIVTWEAGTAHIDLVTTFFLAASLAALLAWWDRDDVRWLAVSGLLGGLAAGTKLNAALFLLPAGLLLATGLWVRHRSSWQTWRALGTYGALSAIPVIPWLARDWIWTGNPVFPFLNQVFRSPLWFADAGLQNFSSFGYRRGPLGWLLLPWDVIVHGGAFGEALGPGVAGAVLWLALPWTLHLQKPFQRRFTAVAWAFLLPALLLESYVAQYLRYMLPLFPLLAAVAAVNIQVAWGAVRQRWRGWLLAPAATILLLGYVAAGRMAQLTWYWHIPERLPIAHFLGKEPREALLSRALREYDALQFLDREGGSSLKVLSVWTPFRLYTTARLFHLSYGKNEALQIITSKLKGIELAKTLVDKGFSHLLLDTMQPKPRWLESKILSAEFLDAHARLVFARNGVVVYRIIPGTGALEIAENLLNNPGFEDLDDRGRPRRWSTFGQPTLSVDQTHAHGGAVAVRATQTEGLTQAVRVRAGTVYTLGHWTRADAAGQASRLQINWLNDKGKIVACSIKAVAAKPKWSWNTLSAMTPENATQAHVYVSVHESSQVWFDDLWLVEGGHIPATTSGTPPPQHQASAEKETSR